MFIYKVMSQIDWEQSQKLGHIKPTDLDVASKFMHMCTEEQIQGIIAKFWKQELSIVVAKIDPSKVVGKLVYESNPGGNNKYYHLYDGTVPIAAVITLELQTKARLRT